MTLELFNISQRRYLGGKTRLLPFIRRTVEEQCGNVQSFFDVFAGTGVVASAFSDKRLVVNDILYSNYLSALMWFGPGKIDHDKMRQLADSYNRLNVEEESNYMSDNFAGTYFSAATCAKIGYIREDIQRQYDCGALTERERALAVTSLLYSMDRIAATCGHYDAYIRHADYPVGLTLRYPDINDCMRPDNLCLNADANMIAPQVECDVAYLDPPYNSRQYCDAYHLLENVARWDAHSERRGKEDGP